MSAKTKRERKVEAVIEGMDEDEFRDFFGAMYETACQFADRTPEDYCTCVNMRVLVVDDSFKNRSRPWRVNPALNSGDVFDGISVAEEYVDQTIPNDEIPTGDYNHTFSVFTNEEIDGWEDFKERL